MPAYYLSKPKCPCCERTFSGKYLGYANKNEPFIFRLYDGDLPDFLLGDWGKLIYDPDLEIHDQWLNVIDKSNFFSMVHENRDKNLKSAFYHQDHIKKNHDGYLYSDIDLHLK
jgi:hypothetical protein